MQSRRSIAALSALLLFALALRVGYVAAIGALGQTPERGYREYAIAAGRLLEQGTLLSPLIVEDLRREPSSLFPPGYVVVTAAAYALLDVESYTATLVLQVVNALATTLTIALVFLAARAIVGVRAAWVAALIATINPLLLGYTDLVWDTSLFTLGTALSVWIASVLSSRRFGVGAYFGFGVWLGALAYLNPALTIAYPFLVLWPLTRTNGWCPRPLLRGTAAVILGWMIAVTPWTVRNFTHFDKLVYIRGGFMHELWLGVCPEADADRSNVFKKRFPLNNEDLQRHVASIGEQAYIDECAHLARDAIASDPIRFVRLIGVRSMDYWMGTVLSHTGPESQVLPRARSRLVVTVFLFAEFAMLVGGLLVRRRIGRQIGWLLAIIVCFSVTYCVTHVELRYRAPTEPLMAIILGAIAMRTGDPTSHRRETGLCRDAQAGRAQRRK